MDLFFNTNEEASNSSVSSLSDNGVRNIPELYLGDSLPLEISFTDGNGGYASWNGESGLSVKVAIGILALNQVYVLQENFTFSNNVYAGTLVLFTETLANALSGQESLDAVLEIQVNRANGQSITIHQSSVTIFNQLIGSQTINPVLDADGDGVPNELESNSPNISVSLPVLNSYVQDTGSLQAGDIIKILVDHDKRGKAFTAGEYYKIYAVSTLGNPRIILDGEEYWFMDNRNVYWQKVIPAPDSDSDGVPDTLDAFPNDSTEQFDSDNDGVGNNTDAFPQDPNESVDTDGDGVGDNSDLYPTDPFESADSDSDGVADNADAFPQDPNETTDSDGDGTGDNSDAFPNDSSETTDTDGDGVGDNSDAFPNDSSETTDTDGDGVGDNSDTFPNDSSETTDTDGDGVGDNSDADPNDPNVTKTPAYFIHGDDGVNGTGYYYPVYTSTLGLSSYHTHTIQGVVVYMEDADANHAQANLPDPNTYIKVANTTAPDSDFDGVEDWADYFSNNSSWNLTKSELDAYSLDPNRPVASNLVVRILQNFTSGSGYYFTQGDYYISTGYSLQSGLIKVTINSVDHWIGNRGNDWEIVNPANNLYNDPDSDGDGVSDSNDAFPYDASETTDTDGDGTGDNSDAFPNDSSETTDSDGDGTGDNADAFPNDSTETTDTDGDGTGDNSDAFPNDPNETTDTDGDGEGDNSDPDPNDPNVTSATDSDGDGVNDGTDYFANDANYTQTQAELDAYSLDTYKTPAVGDIFRVLQDFTETEYQGTNTTDLKTGEYYVITQTGSQWIRYIKDNVTYQTYTTPRGTKWEIVNPASNLTPDPSNVGSFLLDTYFDASVDDPAGMYVRILRDFTQDNHNFVTGEHYEIEQKVTAPFTRVDLEVDANGSTITLANDDRVRFYEIVNPANLLTAKPQDDSRMNDFADKVFFGTYLAGFNYNLTFGEITERYYGNLGKFINVGIDFNDEITYQRSATNNFANVIDNSNNPESAFYPDVFPDPIWKMICTSVTSSSGVYTHTLKYGGSSVKDALPTEAGGNTAQNTLSEEITENIAESLGECLNHSEVLAGNVNDDNHKLHLFIDGVQVVVSEFNTTNGTINFYGSSALLQSGDECEVFKAVYGANPPAILKELYAPRAFYYDAVEKVYHNNAVADIISVDQNAYTLDIDTTGDGSADTTLDIEWGRKYSKYTDLNAIYDVTPAQVFKMKVTNVTSYTGYTNFQLANVDRDDYVIGGNNAVNANPLMSTGNLADFVNGLDNDVAVLNSGGTITGNGKSLIMLVNGVQTSFDGFDNGGWIYIRKNTSNSTLLSVGDIVEIYID